ncbi:MAG TPA: lytic transglycosylase domain-containing protein [Bryobacteraceae bacterium]
MDSLVTKLCIRGRAKVLFALCMTCALVSAPCTSESAPLSEQQLSFFARQCAPSSDPTVLRSVAHVESRFDPFSLHNDTKHISIAPSTLAASAKQAKQWISDGYSVDIGLMQINSGNLSALGMTVEDALDPCRSLEAGASLLSSAYAQGASTADRQAALLIALSRYNTGRPRAGLVNGYVEQVLTAQDVNKARSKPSSATNPQQPDWDVWAVASSEQHDGAAWLIGSQDTYSFLIGAGAQPKTGEPHALSQGPGTAPGM